MQPYGIPLIAFDLLEQDVSPFTHWNGLDKKQEIHLCN